MLKSYLAKPSFHIFIKLKELHAAICPLLSLITFFCEQREKKFLRITPEDKAYYCSGSILIIFDVNTHPVNVTLPHKDPQSQRPTHNVSPMLLSGGTPRTQEHRTLDRNGLGFDFVFQIANLESL